MISRKRTSSYVLTKFFIKSHSKKYKKLMFREKIQKAIFENYIFQKVRKCPPNITGMLNILQKMDQNIYFTSDLR